MATQFHLFPLLPPELRLYIWHLSIPHYPRTLHIHPTSWNDCTTPSTLPPDFRSLPNYKLLISSTTPLLSVCAESRYELLARYYNVRVTREGVAGWTGCETPWEVPFCPEIDTLHIHIPASQKIYSGAPSLFPQLFGHQSEDVLQRLRILAGSERFWDDLVQQENEGLLQRLEKLEEVKLVVSSRTMRIAREAGKGEEFRGVMVRLIEELVGEERARGLGVRVCVAADLSA